MNFSEINDIYELNEDRLLKYGFVLVDNYYELRRELNDNLYVVLKVNEDDFIIDVYDKFEDEKYLPFYVENYVGNYVSEIKEKVDNIKSDVIKSCFTSNHLKDNLIDYVKNKYNVLPEYLWENTPDCCIFRTNKKWFGIIMSIPYKSLGIAKDGIIDIINLKNLPDKILDLIDNKKYFKAYHMNKKYWLTIILNNNIDLDYVRTLIDESFQIVNNKK